RSRAHAPALAKRPAEQGWSRFDKAPERCRHGTGHFLEAWVHVFRSVDDLSFADAVLALDAVETAAAGLQIGDADDVVIGHRHGDVLRCRGGEGVGLCRATVREV